MCDPNPLRLIKLFIAQNNEKQKLGKKQLNFSGFRLLRILRSDDALFSALPVLEVSTRPRPFCDLRCPLLSPDSRSHSRRRRRVGVRGLSVHRPHPLSHLVGHALCLQARPVRQKFDAGLLQRDQVLQLRSFRNV